MAAALLILSVTMVRQTQSLATEQIWEGSHHEVLEGIRLVGQEAPSFPGNPYLQAAMGEELRRIQARARRGDSLARRYVGGRRKVLG